MTTAELVVFDFDGTLAHRPGRWSKCLVDSLDTTRAGHGIAVEDLRPHLRSGFPWHRPEDVHPELNDPEAWWDAINIIETDAYAAVGVTADDELRRAVRDRYCDPELFELYPDTIPALERLAASGVRMTILSNHVPELASIVTHHDLDRYVDDVITSARIGVEKPHPKSFRIALGAIRPERAWMIGDNLVADIQGAEAAGMNSVLVRHPDSGGCDLLCAVRAVLSHSGDPLITGEQSSR